MNSAIFALKIEVEKKQMKNIFCDNRVLIIFLYYFLRLEKVAFVIFGTESLSILRKVMIKTKLLEKMAIIFF